MNTNLEGTGVALVTPFNKREEVDFNGLKNLLDYTSSGGVNYFVVLGTTGESATLTDTEKKQILNFVKENNSKKLPLVYGLGGNNTKEIEKSIKETDLSGVSALLSVSPYYNKPSQEGIYRHYINIADASPVPVILYNVPGRTASNISAETTLRLAEHKNIIGTKEASGNLVQCMEIARSKPQDFLLISGDDLLAVPMISFGAKGVISVLANAFPENFSKMVSLALEGNYEAASKYLFEFLDINTLMYTESNPVGVKEALNLLGVCDNFVRLPLVQASNSLKKEIEKAMHIFEEKE